MGRNQVVLLTMERTQVIPITMDRKQVVLLTMERTQVIPMAMDRNQAIQQIMSRVKHKKLQKTHGFNIII
jgi:hypothetical protein